MLVFINCNTYLGGGETLFVRIACRLQDINIPFHYCPIKKGNSIFETVEL